MCPLRARQLLHSIPKVFIKHVLGSPSDAGYGDSLPVGEGITWAQVALVLTIQDACW